MRTLTDSPARDRAVRLPAPESDRPLPSRRSAAPWLGTLLALVVLAPWARPHDNSSSRTLLVATGPTIDHFVRLQTASLWEVLPLDPDGNLFVEAHELDVVADEVLAYLVAHYELRADDGPTLTPELVGMTLSEDPVDAFAMQQYVELHLRYTCADTPRALQVSMDLFRDTSPTHVDLCAVSWADAGQPPEPPRNSLRLWAGEPVQTAWSGRARPLADDLLAGARAALTSLLALACLLALQLGGVGRGAGRERAAVARAVALALGAATGAALAFGDRLPDPGGAGLAAGLAVVYAAALDLREGSRAGRVASRPLVLEAAVLGGLQGLALLRAQPVPEDGWAPGVGLGAALALTAVGWLVGRRLPGGRGAQALAVAALLVGAHGTWRAWAG